jgi:hypothetical protein
VYERLIEDWLDSASERSYQSPFCQMLLAKGHTVLHSSRHSPIEFGKDIIARNPDGNLCAYQLKRNPGSRLSLTQLREIQGQLIQLVSQPIQLPGIPTTTHRSFLVTNGEIDEEAKVALNEIILGLKNAGYQYPEIELITRGPLLAWAKELGSDLWPSELDDISHLLELLIYNGRKFIPLMKVHSLLSKILILEYSKVKRVSAADLRRRITSAALLTGILLRRFRTEDNHYASIVAWTMFAIYAIGACEKFQLSYERNAKKAVELAKEAIFDSLCDLCNELKERRHFIEGNVLIDNFFYSARQLHLSSLMALLWFWGNGKGWPAEKYQSFIQEFIPQKPNGKWLWGEGAIPQFLMYLWFQRAMVSGIAPDIILAELLNAICERNTKSSLEPLASPYYTIEDVIKHNLRHIIGIENDPLKDESPIRASYFAESLMHLLVRTGLKQNCQRIWRSYSKLYLHWFEPKRLWQYCLWHSKEGVERSKQSPVSEEWAKLCEQARDAKGEKVPPILREEKYLLMLWIIIAPHRGTSSAIRMLGRKFNDCWFIEPAYI